MQRLLSLSRGAVSVSVGKDGGGFLLHGSVWFQRFVAMRTAGDLVLHNHVQGLEAEWALA